LSIPFLIFTCDKCNYRENSLIFFGSCLWINKGQMFAFDRELGLCQSCEGIVVMEKFPNQIDFNRARSLHPSLVGKWVNPINGDKAELMACQKGFPVLEAVLAKKRSPVCLKCGQSNVQPLRLSQGSDIKQSERIGFKHPACGGELMVKGSGGLRVSLRETTFYFDVYGRLITTLDGLHL
jgi:hypothetical protein